MPDLLATWAPQVADALEKVKVDGQDAVVDVEDGIENTTSGPAVVFNVNPEAADRAGFTAEISESIAVGDDGRRAGDRSRSSSTIVRIRLRVRSAEQRASLEAMSNTMIVNSNGGTATLGSLAYVDEVAGPDRVIRENLQRLVEVHGTARRRGSWGRASPRCRKRWPT